ncbi:MAG: PAS domain S-box protein [Hyphomonadaceae bacterium JAD_PAG50586_4]|nr:MAG: PAS domain S-box protein [Hyphomonadaceae bacterium JAD_PAG50586_4]
MGTGQDDAAEPSGAPRGDALTAQLRASLESMPDAFVLLDHEWRFTYVNAKAERQLQRGRETLLGKTIWSAYPVVVGSLAETEYRRIMRDGGHTTFEVDYALNSARVEVRAFRTENMGLALYLRDISKAHGVQQQMRLLQAAVSQLEDIVLITEAARDDSPTPGVVFVNEAFERITGYTYAEVQGRSPQFMRGPLTDLALLEHMRLQLRAGQATRAELIYHTKSGAPLWVDLQMTPFRAPTGEATHIVIVAREISERKRAEQALKQSNERFRIIAQATADVVWDWDLVDDTIWWGDGMRTRFGYAYDQTPQIGESWVQHIHPDDRDRVVTGIHAVIDGGDQLWTDEYRFVRADGSSAQVSDRGFVIRNDNDVAVRMVGAMLDVTEQRELESQLRQSQRLEAVGQLTGGVAHDFNNLLTVILSNAELLEIKLAGNEQMHALAEMTRIAAERGAELTSRLLSFSRRQALDPKATDVAQLARGMEGLLKRALGEHVEVRISATDDLWDALIDKLQLESAILNLCINARDAMPDGGTVSIELANVCLLADGNGGAAGDYVVVCVGDTGAGMDEPTKARAFEPFFTTKEIGKGSGLGLSMVYGFVTQSKGRIEIDTQVGEGTRIKLYLPRARDGEQVVDEAGIGDDFVTGHERVLLVEDDDLVRVQVANELREMGYRVVTARHGAEAIELLRADTAFDLLFTDVVMPGGVNGRQLADAARELVPGLPVLYTSGNPDIVLAEEGRLASGTHLLRKPYRRRELGAKLRQALAGRSQNGA